jgi:hypothetical protein
LTLSVCWMNGEQQRRIIDKFLLWFVFGSHSFYHYWENAKSLSLSFGCCWTRMKMEMKKLQTLSIHSLRILYHQKVLFKCLCTSSDNFIFLHFVFRRERSLEYFRGWSLPSVIEVQPEVVPLLQNGYLTNPINFILFDFISSFRSYYFLITLTTLITLITSFKEMKHNHLKPQRMIFVFFCLFIYYSNE